MVGYIGKAFIDCPLLLFVQLRREFGQTGGFSNGLIVSDLYLFSVWEMICCKYLQFGNKICLAVSILCFVDVCSNAGSSSADLVADNCFVLTFEKFYQIQDFNRKGNREVNELI